MLEGLKNTFPLKNTDRQPLAGLKKILPMAEQKKPMFSDILKGETIKRFLPEPELIKGYTPPSVGLKGIVNHFIPSLGSTLGSMGKELGQSMMRNIASVIGSEALEPIVKPITDKVEGLKKGSLTFQYFTEELSNRLYGDLSSEEKTELTGETRLEQIAPVGERTLLSEKRLKEKGQEYLELSKTPGLNTREKLVTETLGAILTEQPTFLAPAMIIAYVGLDLTPVGGSEKGAIKVFKQTDNIGDAFRLLTKMGVVDDLAREFSEQVVKTKTDDAAKKLFDHIVDIQKTTKVSGKAPITPSAKLPIKTTTPKDLELLAQEARKYKSAEEFVNSMEEIQKRKVSIPVSYTGEKFEIEKLQDELKKYTIKAAEITTEDAKKAFDIAKKEGKSWAKNRSFDNPNVFAKAWEEATPAGIDVNVGKLNKSQLTDIYNQAVKGVKAELPIKPIIPKELEPLPIHLRKETTDAMIKAYAEKNPVIMRRPISMIKENGKIKVLEGEHRFYSAKQAGVEPPMVLLTRKATDNLNAPEIDTLAKKVYTGKNLPELTDFYNQAVKGVKAEVPKLTKATPKILEPTTIKAIPQKLEGIKKQAISSQVQNKLIKSQSQLGEQVIKGQLPIQRKSLPESYKIFGDKSSVIKKTENFLSPLNAGGKTEKIGLYKKFSNTLSDYWTRFNETIQDDWYRVRKMVQKKGVKVSDASDPYLKRELYFGRVGTKIEEVKDTVKMIDKDILTTSKKIKVGDKQLADEVNKYLYYRHAPERNLAIGEKAAGITTKEARIGLKELESLPHYKEITRIADKLQNLNNKTLDTLLDGEVITKDLYDLLRTKYKNHIPLQRIFAETEDVSDILISGGLDVRGTGIKRAVGSQRKVADIFSNITANYEQALIRAEKNRVDLATLKFARENKYFNGLFEEIKPSAIGKTFDKRMILKEVRDPQVLALRELGKPVYLKINDPKLAVALKGVNRQKMDGVMRIIGSFTRLYSGLMTRFNPEFAFPNKIRDLQEMAVYMASKKEVGFKGALKTTVRDPASVKDIVDYLRGADTSGAKLYKEMKELGGTTGGLGLSTRKQLDLDIESIRLLNRKSPRKAAEKAIGYIDDWNTLFEDSTRLSVYKQGLKSGLSKERATALAKESTINFNRMGTAGPVINGIYMFSNASIQGSVKMLRAMKDPKVAAITIGSVIGAVAATQEWNDSLDENWRDKVSKWDRMNGLTVVLPSKEQEKFNYITIPISWGIKPINVMSNYSVDLMNDKKTNIEDAMSEIFASVVDAYNPVGGTDFFSAIAPTILDLPLDISRNRKWSGNTIRPDWDKNAPKSEQYFDSLKETPLGKMTINISEKVSQKSGGRIEISPADSAYATQQLVGGFGRFISKGINTITDIFKGEMRVKEIPFVSRFVRSKDIEETGYGTGITKEVQSILTEQSRERIKTKREAEAIYEQFKKLPKEQATEAFKELVKTDKKMAEKISDIAKEEKLGLTYTDRLVKQLGVENGERAKYILSQLKKLEDKESKTIYWQELVDKKIITKQVNDQLIKLLKEI